MKELVTGLCVLAFCNLAAAQESDVTHVTTKTETVSSDFDLIAPLFFFEDAVPLECGKVDLRFHFQWITGGDPAGQGRKSRWWDTSGSGGLFGNKRDRGDGDDDFVLTPAIYWGITDNLELSARVPMWLGDGGDKGALDESNFDSELGMLWRFREQEGWFPALALSSTLRLPTGDRSNKFDVEMRLVMTNDYDSGLRSHINAFMASVNGNSDENLRHFQWGFVFGLDGPLCADGSVRWVADYMHRSSHHYGASNMNILELGWQWDISEAHRLGMATQIALDRVDDTPNFGAGITYSWSIGS